MTRTVPRGRSGRLAAVLALALAVAGGTTVPAAAPQDPGSNPLQSVKTLQCSFTTYEAAGWAGNTPEIVRGSDKFDFEIADINLKKHTGHVVGGNGSALVTAMLTDTGLNVIEQTPMGNFILTTVFVAGHQDRHFVAVHSRHLGDVSKPPTASQYYGTCDAVQ